MKFEQLSNWEVPEFEYYTLFHIEEDLRVPGNVLYSMSQKLCSLNLSNNQTDSIYGTCGSGQNDTYNQRVKTSFEKLGISLIEINIISFIQINESEILIVDNSLSTVWKINRDLDAVSHVACGLANSSTLGNSTSNCMLINPTSIALNLSNKNHFFVSTSVSEVYSINLNANPQVELIFNCEKFYPRALKFDTVNNLLYIAGKNWIAIYDGKCSETTHINTSENAYVDGELTSASTVYIHDLEIIGDGLLLVLDDKHLRIIDLIHQNISTVCFYASFNSACERQEFHEQLRSVAYIKTAEIILISPLSTQTHGYTYRNEKIFKIKGRFSYQCQKFTQIRLSF